MIKDDKTKMDTTNTLKVVKHFRYRHLRIYVDSSDHVAVPIGLGYPSLLSFTPTIRDQLGFVNVLTLLVSTQHIRFDSVSNEHNALIPTSWCSSEQSSGPSLLDP